MLNRFKNILLLSVFSWAITICPTASFAWHDYVYGSYGDWYYHGSGRDQPYSYYIDQSTPGPADYALTEPPEYVDAVSYFNNAPMPVEAFTINIPNDHGGYTPVVIRRSGNGFVGPQGEFYPAFPSVAQLKIIYGK